MAPSGSMGPVPVVRGQERGAGPHPAVGQAKAAQGPVIARGV